MLKNLKKEKVALILVTVLSLFQAYQLNSTNLKLAALNERLTREQITSDERRNSILIDLQNKTPKEELRANFELQNQALKQLLGQTNQQNAAFAALQQNQVVLDQKLNDISSQLANIKR